MAKLLKMSRLRGNGDGIYWDRVYVKLMAVESFITDTNQMIQQVILLCKRCTEAISQE